eukprot:scaffold97041_cov22-Tisochrysis_lutea.AAC.1
MLTPVLQPQLYKHACTAWQCSSCACADPEVGAAAPLQAGKALKHLCTVLEFVLPGCSARSSFE